ncbi:uncharacterized protein [Rutidosis leptorrhynchoides]|uniref:uncharacterized protein isoform X2 n=1 Tax=Rutidosis leptorrhynchoides TaxID=125765 RepID=UPI003A9A0863
MPPRKKLIKRKKSLSSSTPNDINHESPAPEVVTETELTDNSRSDDVQTNVSIQEQVPKPNSAEIKSVSISSENLINDDGGEPDVKPDAKPDCIRQDEPEKQKIDLQKTENNVEAAVETNSAQAETTAVQVDGIKISSDDNNSVVVKSDDHDKCEETAKVAEDFSAQHCIVSEAPCQNNDALVVENGVKHTVEIVVTHESTALDVKDDSKVDGDDDRSNGDRDRDQDQDRALAVQDSTPDDKKDTGVEFYVGKLHKDTVEDDLLNVFQKFGELQSIRILRNSNSKKSKGFAFVRFAAIDQAKRALSELKDGFEVKEKHVNLSVSEDKDTLFLGNICKTWKKEEVLQQLKHYGVENVDTIRVPEDPKNGQKNKGHAFLEFTTHSVATEACKRLKKQDVLFGRDKNVTVSFAGPPTMVNQVFLEGLTNDWNEEKVKDMYNKYGEIVKVYISRSSGTKQKGYISFASPESAQACVEGINNTLIGEEAKIIAGIVKPKPQPRNSRQKQGLNGGLNVNKQSDVSTSHKESGINKNSEVKVSKMKGVSTPQQSKGNKKGSSKRVVKIKTNPVKPQQKVPLKKDDESSKVVELPKTKADMNIQQAKSKRKLLSEKKVHARDQGTTPKKPKIGGEGENSNTASKGGNRKRKKIITFGGREDRNIHEKKPLKKKKGNIHERERGNFRNPKGDTNFIRRQDDYRNSARYTEIYAPKYAASAPTAYHLGPDPLSARRLKEMEPHAGYIEPSSATQTLSYSRYVQPVVRTSHTQHQTVYLEPSSTSQSQLHSRYLDRSGLTQSHRGYIETAAVPKVQPYPDYRSSEYVQIAHDPYDSGHARVVRHDVRGAGVVTYVGGPPPPTSQVRNHTSYYEGSSSYSGAYSSQRTYY